MSALEILLVEDNANDAELTMRAFRQRNLANSISWVRDGVEAMEFIFGSSPIPGQLQRRPEVILLDLKMPRIDGVQVLERLKADPTAKTIPVVVLTSSREIPDVQRCYELGVNSYIVKPVNFDNFSEVVAQLGMYWLMLNERPVPSP